MVSLPKLEILLLSLIEGQARHGYELAKLIEQRSEGVIEFPAASLYPTLYRLERQGRITGRWVEKPGMRRRRFYSLTAAGRKHLTQERRSWRILMRAISAIALPEGS